MSRFLRSSRFKSCTPLLMGVLGMFFCGAATLGCDESSRDQAAPKKGPPSTTTRRCGDFLSEAEAKLLGIEDYRAGKGDKNPLRGVVCAMDPVMVSIFMADQYGTMTSRVKKLKGMKAIEGVPVGRESFWFEAHDNVQVLLVSKTGRYAFAISGTSKELVEKAAKLSSEGK